MRQLHRTASIIAGIYSLLQALIYTIFTIYGCAIYTCLAEFPFSHDSHHKTSDLLYLAYFKGKCRALAGEPQVEASSVTRTYYFLIVYGIASAVWIPTSTLLVVASVSRVKGRQGALLFYPWIINTVVIILLDAIGGIWYGLDIAKTLTAQEFKSFIGSNIGPVPSGIDGITVAPAMIMAGIFIRGAIFWIINVILLGVVIQAAVEVKKTFSASDFINGSAPKSVQRQLEKEAEQAPKPQEAEVRWVRVKNEVILPRLEMVEPAPAPPRQQPPQPAPPPQQPQQPAPELPRDDYPLSPQSPFGPDAPPPVIRRRPSLQRSGSSPVFDVVGMPTGETFPFPQDPNRRYEVPPSRYQEAEDREREARQIRYQDPVEREREPRQIRYQDPVERERDPRQIRYQDPIEREREPRQIRYQDPVEREREPMQIRYQDPVERERDMNRERAIERETERDMARKRELERERQDKEFQRLRIGGASQEGSPRNAPRRGVGEPREDDVVNNQRPWQYVRPGDLNLRPKYDKTMKPRFAPEVAPKPAIPPPDYSAPGQSRWDPTNLSRSNSNAAYPDQRWNPRRAY